MKYKNRIWDVLKLSMCAELNFSLFFKQCLSSSSWIKIWPKPKIDNLKFASSCSQSYLNLNHKV